MKTMDLSDAIDAGAVEAKNWGIVSKHGEWTDEETQWDAACDIISAALPAILEQVADAVEAALAAHVTTLSAETAPTYSKAWRRATGTALSAVKGLAPAPRHKPAPVQPPPGNDWDQAEASTVMAAALEWLYDVEQPDGAMPALHGYSTTVGGRRVRVVQVGALDLPVIVVEVAHPFYQNGTATNRLGAGEMARWVELLAGLGAEVRETWNGDGYITGSVGLSRPAHPSLLAGGRRYCAGCPEHGSVFCSDQGCTWLGDGHALAVKPRFGEFSKRCRTASESM